MAKMMFYERPIPLNRERHQQLKVAPVADHYRFASRTNAVPIISTEFGEAARDYPIVFVGEERGAFSVAALVGLRDNENLMVDDAGRWAAGTYVPAFARRYPFVLAKTDGSEQLTVCVDEVHPGLGTEAGEALFLQDGKASPYLERVLEFLKAFHAEALRTAAFAGRLKELGLLVPKVINVERAGHARRSMRGLWVVDPVKFRGLDDVRVVELFRSGYLGWIEAHLISLGSLARLVSRLDEHTAVSDETGVVVLGDADAAEPPVKH